VSNPGDFTKGDPRISPYSKGDGRKRKPFVKGDDPRRISPERLAEVTPMKKGVPLSALRDRPKVGANTRVDLIKAEFQVEVSPEVPARELLPMLSDAIDFGERMMGMIVKKPTVKNALDVGLYTVLINKCIKTRAEIEGGAVQPAAFGKLDADAVEKIKEELAYLLHCNLTKLNHGLHYAATHDIFDESGQVRHWASRDFRALLSGIRTTMETRARLDAWEHKKDRKMAAVEAAYWEA
jgi:hypothetical protein